LKKSLKVSGFKPKKNFRQKGKKVAVQKKKNLNLQKKKKKTRFQNKNFSKKKRPGNFKADAFGVFFQKAKDSFLGKPKKGLKIFNKILVSAFKKKKKLV